MPDDIEYRLSQILDRLSLVVAEIKAQPHESSSAQIEEILGNLRNLLVDRSEKRSMILDRVGEFTGELKKAQEAHGNAISQASNHSISTVIQKIFFLTLPFDFQFLPDPDPKRDIRHRLLEHNPVDKIIDFDTHIENFVHILEGQHSHAVLISSKSNMGKSHLLYRLMHMCQELDHVFCYVDLSGKLIYDLRDIFKQIGQQTQLVHPDGDTQDFVTGLENLCANAPDKKCVVFIDHTEAPKNRDLVSDLADELYNVIRQQWVPNLIVVIAGNQNVPSISVQDGFDERYFTIYPELPNWTENHIRHYVDTLKLEMDHSTINLIHRLSNWGIPADCVQLVAIYQSTSGDIS